MLMKTFVTKKITFQSKLRSGNATRGGQSGGFT